MTPEMQTEILQLADRLRQTIQRPYRDAVGAEEYALSVVLEKVAEIEGIVRRCGK